MHIFMNRRYYWLENGVWHFVMLPSAWWGIV